jgi:hypothetical protein
MSCQPSSVTTMVTGEGWRAGMPNSGNAFPMVTAATTHTHSRLLPIPSSPTRRVTAGAGDAVLGEPARRAAGLRSVAHQSFGKPSMSVFAENSAGSGVLSGDLHLLLLLVDQLEPGPRKVVAATLASFSTRSAR